MLNGMPALALRVLVIGDAVLGRHRMKNVLTDAGMEVFEQPSGIGATRAILQNGIDAAVIDDTIPGLSSDRLVSLLRANARLRGLTIVVVSARPWDELQALGRECQADAVMSQDEVGNRLVPVLLRAKRSTSGQYSL